MALFGLAGRYEVRRGASSTPDPLHPRHRDLDSAKERADEVDGYVLVGGTWDVAYASPGYLAKFPLKSGGGQEQKTITGRTVDRTKRTITGRAK